MGHDASQGRASLRRISGYNKLCLVVVPVQSVAEWVQVSSSEVSQVLAFLPTCEENWYQGQQI